jgi:hypothetical protein
MSWVRVNSRSRCPICGKPDWCLIGTDGGAICARMESPYRQGEAGWYHPTEPGRVAVQVQRGDTPPAHPAEWWKSYAEQCQADGVGRLPGLARELGVTVEALERLCTGWSGDAWTFPMLDVAGRILGVRLRLPSGRKLAVRGGREGLFYPLDLPTDLTTDTMLVCEGPTDCAAALDLGALAVGRPSCTGGVRHIVELVQRRCPGRVVVMADDDGPGRRGAEALASTLLPYIRQVQVLTPPAKDLRAWMRTGATRAQFQGLIAGAPTRRLPRLSARRIYANS